MFVQEDDRFMIRPSGKAILFGHILLVDGKSVRIEFFDCTSGWGYPVVTIEAEEDEGYSPFDSYRGLRKTRHACDMRTLRLHSIRKLYFLLRQISDRTFEQFIG